MPTYIRCHSPPVRLLGLAEPGRASGMSRERGKEDRGRGGSPFRSFRILGGGASFWDHVIELARFSLAAASGDGVCDNGFDVMTTGISYH